MVFTTESEDVKQLNLKQNTSPLQKNLPLSMFAIFSSILYRLLTADKKFTSHK